MPLPPPVIKIVLLVSFIIKSPKKNYVTIYKVARKLSFAVGKSVFSIFFNRRNRYSDYPLSGLHKRACRCGLARERFTQELRCHCPFDGSWHNCINEAVQSAGNYSGPVFPQRVKALGYALLHAHRLQRHGPRVEPKLGQHRRVCQRGRHDGNVDAPRLELVVKRFPETVDIRLGATVIRQERNPNFRAHRPYEDKAAPASRGEFRAEMVGDVQMRHRIEPQSRLKQLPIELEELARIWGAGIGDDKPDVDIVRSVGESRDESLL